jgi:CelD/BcsL family acetyltransferase involved in cellulose biosynthesis
VNPVIRNLARQEDLSPEPPSRVPATATSLTVDVQHDVSLRPADAAALNWLVAERPSVGVFVSTAWLAGLFAEPPDDWQPALVLFRAGAGDPGAASTGALRAIVPIAVRHALTHVHVRLLGGGLGSDRIDLLAARGFEAGAADAFLRWIGETFGRRAFVLELRDVPADSPLWGAVHRAGIDGQPRLVLQPREVHTLPYLSLDEDAHAGGAGRNPPSLDRHRRWLERRGSVTVEVLDDPGEVIKAFDQLRRFLHVRWKDQACGSVLDNPRTVRFHQRAVRLLLNEGRLRMIRLLVGTRTAAVFYGLSTGAWRGYYLAGYDREWAGRIHLGQLTLATAIDTAGREGATEFDFLKGADRVKYLWPVRERTTIDADAYSQKSGAQLRRATRASRDAVVALAKSVREIFI